MDKWFSLSGYYLMVCCRVSLYLLVTINKIRCVLSINICMHVSDIYMITKTISAKRKGYLDLLNYVNIPAGNHTAGIFIKYNV